MRMRLHAACPVCLHDPCNRPSSAPASSAPTPPSGLRAGRPCAAGALRPDARRPRGLDPSSVHICERLRVAGLVALIGIRAPILRSRPLIQVQRHTQMVAGERTVPTLQCGTRTVLAPIFEFTSVEGQHSSSESGLSLLLRLSHATPASFAARPTFTRSRRHRPVLGGLRAEHLQHVRMEAGCPSGSDDFDSQDLRSMKRHGGFLLMGDGAPGHRGKLGRRGARRARSHGGRKEGSSSARS